MIGEKYDFFAKHENFGLTSSVKSVLIVDGNAPRKPEITIFIPTYLRADSLKQTLEGAVRQSSFYSFEILVLDNNPDRDDETEILMRQYIKFPIRYYKNEKNLGMVGNWNRGYELAQGKWVTMIHDDDLLHTEYLSVISRIISSFKSFDGLFCTNIKFQEIPPSVEMPTEIHAKRMTPYNVVWRNDFPIAGNLLKRQMVIESGGFDPDTYAAPDYAFYVYLSRHFRIYKINAPLAFYRMGMNISLKVETIDSIVHVNHLINLFILKKSKLASCWSNRVAEYWKYLVAYKWAKLNNPDFDYKAYEISPYKKILGRLLQMITKYLIKAQYLFYLSIGKFDRGFKLNLK